MHTWESSTRSGKRDNVKVHKKDSANTVDKYKNTVFPNNKW